jgi:peptidoglycan/LPS O-acetylase OafA/YrhL
VQRADPIAPEAPALPADPGPAADPAPAATTPPVDERPPGPDRPGTSWRAAAAVGLGVLVLLGVVLAGSDPQPNSELLVQLVRYVGSAGIVLVVPGFALARLLTPRRLGRWWPVLVLPMGLAGSTLVLTVLALLTLRPRPATIVFLLLFGALALWTLLPGRGRGRVPAADWPAVVALVAGAAGAALLTLIPVLHAGFLTVPGNNPDAHQVVGVAWYLQEAYPLGIHTQTALDRVPAAWSGRIPIFHPFGAAIEVGLTGPIQMFAPFVALVTAIVAIGAGLFASAAHRLAGWGTGIVALLVGGSAATLFSALHPYYNQLWGMALLSTTLALAWVWLAEDDTRAGALSLLFLVLSLIAYPTTLPYAVLVVGAIAVGARKRPRIPAGVRRRLRRIWPLLVVFFGVSVLGALGKLAGVLAQFLGDTPFWQGDINVFPPHGAAYGLANDVVAVPILVAVVAGATMLRRDRRSGLAWLGLGALLLLLDLVLRGRGTAEYVDYKHVTFTALILLPIALGGAIRLLADLGRRRSERTAGTDRPRARRLVPAAIGAVVLLAWGVPAFSASRAQVDDAGQNVTPPLFDVLRWTDEIPQGRSVLIDLPASGTQLWATLFLGEKHPLATTDPVSSTTTYSVAPRGRRADYVLGLKLDLKTGRPVPPPRWAAGAPILQDSQFGVWRMVLPAAQDRSVPSTASTKLVEPHPEPDGEAARRELLDITGNPSRYPGF